MAITVETTDTFEQWRVKTNSISLNVDYSANVINSNIGNLLQLVTITKSNIVAAINETQTTSNITGGKADFTDSVRGQATGTSITSLTSNSGVRGYNVTTNSNGYLGYPFYGVYAIGPTQGVADGQSIAIVGLVSGAGNTAVIAQNQTTNSYGYLGAPQSGIQGRAPVNTGQNQAIGVTGLVYNGASNTAVYGFNTISNSQGWMGYDIHGVYGYGPTSNVATSRGVTGLATGNANVGVYGENYGTNSYAYMGYKTSGGDSYGVLTFGGLSNATTYTGVYGSVRGNTTTSNIAIRGKNDTTLADGYIAFRGIGVFGAGGTVTPAGSSIGVQGQANGSSNVGVFGACDQAIGYLGYGNTYGAYGSSPSYGVYGSALGYGIYGTTANPTGAGVAGFNSNTSSYAYIGYSVYGLYSEAPYGLYSIGNIYATADIISASDARLKSNVVTINNALDIVSNLRGVRYTVTQTGQTKIGLIAQEVQDYVPEVIDAGNEYLGISYPNLVGLLVEAIKDLKKEIEILKMR
jgi:hypothetical protein